MSSGCAAWPEEETTYLGLVCWLAEEEVSIEEAVAVRPIDDGGREFGMGL